MYICQSCQSKTEQLYKFCPQCGQAALVLVNHTNENHTETLADQTPPPNNAPQGYAPPPNNAPEPSMQQSVETPASRKSKKFKIFASIGVGAVLLIVVGVVLFNLFLNKNAKELYLYAELKTYENQLSSSSLFGKADMEFFDKLEEMTSDTNITLTGDISIDSSNNEGFDEIAEVINNVAIELNLQQNPNDLWGKYNLKVKDDGESVLDAMFMFYDDIFAFKGIGDLDKMHYSSFEELQNIYSGTESKDDETDKVDVPKVTEEQMEKLQKEYSAFIVSQLKDDYFTLEKDNSYTTSEGNVKAKKLTVSINEDEVRTMLISLVDKLRGDKEAQELFANSLFEYIKESPSVLTPAEQLAYVKERIEDGLYELKTNVIDAESLGSFEMVLYLNKKNEIIDRKMTISRNEDSSPYGYEVNIHQTNWDLKKGLDQSTFDIELEAFSYGETASLLIESETTTEMIDKVRDAKSKITITAYVSGSDEVSADINWRAREATKEGGEDRYTFDIDITSVPEAPTISGDITRKVDQKLNDNYSKQTIKGNIEFMLNMLGERETMEIGFNIDSKTTFDDKIAKPVLDKDAVNLKELGTDESYNKLEDLLDMLPSDSFGIGESLY